MVSSIDGINQTSHSTNKQRPCTNQERGINLSILPASGLFSVMCQITPRSSIPGGALPINSLSFSLATVLSPEPTNIDFSEGAEGVTKHTTPTLQSAWFMVKTTTVP